MNQIGDTNFLNPQKNYKKNKLQSPRKKSLKGGFFNVLKIKNCNLHLQF